MERASRASGSPNLGWSSANDVAMSSRPTRESTATPFHWLSPKWATS